MSPDRCSSLTFLVDVDDTLLDNDRIREDVQAHFVTTFGSEVTERYWGIQERRFVELGYRDYLGAVQEHGVRGRIGIRACSPRPAISSATRSCGSPLRRGARGTGAPAHARRRSSSRTATPSSSHTRSSGPGSRARVDGNVLVYVHKELELDDVERRYPAVRYVLVDDKLRILTAAKAFWEERATTCSPAPGAVRTDPEIAASHPAADVTIDAIGDLLRFDASRF